MLEGQNNIRAREEGKEKRMVEDFYKGITRIVLELIIAQPEIQRDLSSEN